MVTNVNVVPFSLVLIRDGRRPDKRSHKGGLSWHQGNKRHPNRNRKHR